MVSYKALNTTLKSRITYRSNTGRNGHACQATATIKSRIVYRSNTGRDGQACQTTTAKKAPLPIEVTLEGMVMLVKPLQPEKA